MIEPEEERGEAGPRKGNKQTLVLVGALVLLLLCLGYFATRGNPDQDKLTNRIGDGSASSAPAKEKLCASSATYELIKGDLFRRAAQLRGSGQAAFDRISSAAVVRMENPVMENQDSSSGALNCSGSLFLDLPPGVEVVGGRHTLSSDLDYTVTMAADGRGPVVLLKNADAIVTPLATLAATNQAARGPAPPVEQGNAVTPSQATATPPSAQEASPPAQTESAPTPRPSTARPSFDCSSARTRGEIAVCNDAGLAALDRQMAAQYSRAYALASSEERNILKDTAHGFYVYRDRCGSNACIGDAYTGRMREISDIMAGRWQPTR